MGQRRSIHPAQARYLGLAPAERFAVYRQLLPDGALWVKVVPSPAGCLLWTGATIKGYGSMRRATVHYYAHRYTYLHLVGPIPEDLDTLDHVECQTPLCVDPAHTEPVTRGENRRRGPLSGMAAIHAAKTHCGRCGGPLTPVPHRRSRRCEPCTRALKRAWSEAQKVR